MLYAKRKEKKWKRTIKFKKKKQKNKYIPLLRQLIRATRNNQKALYKLKAKRNTNHSNKQNYTFLASTAGSASTEAPLPLILTLTALPRKLRTKKKKKGTIHILKVSKIPIFDWFFFPKQYEIQYILDTNFNKNCKKKKARDGQTNLEASWEETLLYHLLALG